MCVPRNMTVWRQLEKYSLTFFCKYGIPSSNWKFLCVWGESMYKESPNKKVSGNKVREQNVTGNKVLGLFFLKLFYGGYRMGGGMYNCTQAKQGVYKAYQAHTRGGRPTTLISSPSHILLIFSSEPPRNPRPFNIIF